MDLITFKIQRQFTRIEYQSLNVQILFCIDHNVRVEVSQGVKNMTGGDLISINPKEKYVIEGKGAKVAFFEIDRMQLQQLLRGKYYKFNCDSTEEVNDNYDILRQMLTEYLLIFYEGREFQEIEKQQKAAEILLFLVHHFSSVQNNDIEADRSIQIRNYLEQNCNEELSLEQIANEFHMTRQYFSKYFRKTMGETFYKYLNRIRVENAAIDLSYNDENLTYIALKNGFANTNAFLKYFKEFYGISPQEYRKKIQRENDRDQAEIMDDLKTFFEVTDITEAPEYKSIILSGDAGHIERFIEPWKEMANIEDASCLSDYLIREQLEQIQKAMGFSYIRTKMHVPKDLIRQEYSFYQEEQFLDYLYHLKLQMWFVIDYRTVADWENLYLYLERMLSYFSNRYSIGHIRQWRVELVYDTIFTREKCIDYWNKFDRIDKLCKRFNMIAPVFGPGLSLGNIEGLKEFFSFMKETGRMLEYQTFKVLPYKVTSENGKTMFSRSTDAGYIRNQLLTLRLAMPDMIADADKTYITGWNDSITSQSALNDRCYKGSYIIKNMIDCIGEVKVLGHEVLLDSLDHTVSTEQELVGGNGLLSKHGIPKPSFHAYKFLNKIGSDMICKTENGIVTIDSYQNFHVVAHNCKRLNYKYYLDEAELNNDLLEGYFVDTEPQQIKVHLSNVQNGTYIIKKRSLSSSHGSAGDLLDQMMIAKDAYVHINDLEYIKQLAVPEVSIDKIIVENHILDLSFVLAENEFVHIHIIYQY